MSLTVRLKNIGILKRAEFSLGDLTIICGENNMGKTYATYALYGFLRSWHTLFDFSLSDSHIHSLLRNGVIKIELAPYINVADHMIKQACKGYKYQLDDVFAESEGRFHNSEFHIETGAIDIHDKEYYSEFGNLQKRLFTSSKKKGSEKLTVALAVEKNVEREIDSTVADDAVSLFLKDAIFSDAFPNPFISSAERTGVATFRKELNFARNQLLKEMVRSNQQIDLRALLSNAYQNYPSPIEADVNFMDQLQDIAKDKSFIAKEHPEILTEFADIIGGEYAITQNDQLYYIPKGMRLRLTMDQSSSAVRSLLDLNFYLHCVAEKGGLLMIDEPELSLHPENQRRIARLFARLVNLGVKVFITTHSDYIVKELNTLIMLNHDKPHLKRVAEENGYQDSELIKAEQVKVYVAEKVLLDLEEGQKKRKRGHTLIPADIDPEFGIEVGSFDKTIDAMNKIQRDIVWGAK